MSAGPFSAIHADAWASDFSDVPSLNRAASDLLARRIDETRLAGGRGEGPRGSASVLLLGPAGSGKTHLFTRLRKQIGPRAVFVHMRPEIGAEPSPRHVLAAVVRSLRRPVSQEDRQQLDVIVGAMLADIEGQRAHFPLAFLDDLRARDPDAQRAVIERAVSRVEDRCPEIWPRYLVRLLSVLFAGAADQRALFAWLSGEEPSQLELDRIGERIGLRDEDVLPALRTLGAVASLGAPLVLVLDQLENLCEEEGRHGRIHAHARVVSELRDTVRGLVLVQMALEAVWIERIRPALHMSDRSRLEEDVELLVLPTREEKRDLVELWRSALPAPERGASFPHPFSTAQVEEWIHGPGTSTPRMLMQACGEAYLRVTMGSPPSARGAAPAASSPDVPLGVQWEKRLDDARALIDDEAHQERGVPSDSLRGGLLAALGLLGEETAAVPKREAISLRLSGAQLACDVLIAQHAHHRSLASVIRAATALAAERPSLLLRERAFAIRPTWREVERLLETFEETPGARFVPIDREDLARLLALASLLCDARSQDLCGEDGQPIPYADVEAWARRALGCAEWPPIAAILGRRQNEQAPEPEAEAVPQLSVTSPAPERAPLPASELAADCAQPAADMTSMYDVEGRALAEDLGQRIRAELVRQRVAVTIRGTAVGPRLMHVEVHCAHQRVAQLDRAAADVEHNLSSEGVRFERRGARRFFLAPRQKPRLVLLDALLARKEEYLRARPGRFVVGEALDGEVLAGDLSDGSACHLLIAGQTGSGKSLLLRSLILSLCRFHPPSAIRFLLMDPKRVTFGGFAAGIAAYLAAPVFYDAEALLPALDGLVTEMEARYAKMESCNAQNLDDYNAADAEPLPRVVVVVDEFQDLLASKALRQPFLDAVKRLGAKARAAGIHLILATQRPDKNTVPGEIKANLCGRIALRVQEAVNSRIILDQGGAEELLGRGDLYANLGHGLVRAQAPMP